jgi:transcriptional regulator with XRE-family HTH domain
MAERDSRKRLRLLRTDRELTQIEVAHLAGIPKARYWYIESGYGTPTKDEADAIARVLRTTVRYIGFRAIENERVAS